MARLQRKKSTTLKKKKPRPAEVDAPDVSEADNGVVETPAPAREAKRKPLPAKKPTPARKEPGRIQQYIEQALQFLREVRIELKKVTWPSRKQTLGSTAVVIVLVLVIALFLGAVDIGLSSLVRLVLQ